MTEQIQPGTAPVGKTPAGSTGSDIHGAGRARAGANPADTEQRPVLALKSVTKKFRATTALKDITLELRPREVLGLIGENGAGKSTLLKILTGLEQPTDGQLLLNGTPTSLRGIRGAQAHGIAMVHQEQSLIDTITAGENVLLGNEGATVAGGVYRWGQLRARAQEYIDRVGADVLAERPTSTLSFAKRQMLEVAKALASAESGDSDPVILLDEPTSVLEAEEIERLFAVIDQLRARASVIFVSHRMEEVLRVCDRIYVLRDGEVVGERIPGKVEEDELYQLLIGEDLSEGFYHQDARAEAKDTNRVTIEKLSGPSFSDIDLELRAGEIVSVLGVQGSGREELGQAIFGAVPTTGGSVAVDGERLRFRTPTGAVQSGVGYVPSDRKTSGCVLSMSVTDNVVLAHPGEVSHGGVLDPKKARTMVHSWIDRLRIKTPSSLTPIRDLSGGNQQKVVLSKWLLDPELRVIILDTPTRGLDVGAKSDVYQLIRSLAEQGVTVLLIADTLEEGIHMSHRVITMRDGRISGEFPCTPESLPDRADVLERMI